MRCTKDSRLCPRATARLRVGIVPTIRQYHVRFFYISVESVQSRGGSSPLCSKGFWMDTRP